MASIDSFYAAGGCGIRGLNTSTGSTENGYINIGRIEGDNVSNYGLNVSGQWAREFSYGTVWGMAKCSETAGNNSSNTWPESSKTDWLKTPSDTTGQYCWCQATGFTASGNSYTSGPQCTTDASSSWVFLEDVWAFDYCANYCAHDCAGITFSAFRVALFGAVPPDPTVLLNWYDGNSTISGPSSCVIGGTFVPPTPPARTGYVFAGWKVKPRTCGIPDLDSSINGTAYGYANLDGSTGSNESKYGLTVGSGQWAVETSYGVVYGMANCNNVEPNDYVCGWIINNSLVPESSGKNCWCQATGFTPTASSYTSGPSCIVTPSSSAWVWECNASTSSESWCSQYCANFCADSYSTDSSDIRGTIIRAAAWQ